MKIKKTNELFENSEKKIVKNLSFVLILLNQAFFLPILLRYGKYIFRFIMDMSDNIINNTWGGWEIGYFLFILLPFITFVDLQYFFMGWIFVYCFFNILKYYFIRKKSKNSRCCFCEKKAKMAFFKCFLRVPSFFRFFGIPICEYHSELVINDHNIFLIEGQRIYKRYTFLIRWINILIIISGIIILSISLFSFQMIHIAENRNILIILSYIFFIVQVVLYVYLNVSMFLKVKKGINKTIEKEELE